MPPCFRIAIHSARNSFVCAKNRNDSQAMTSAGQAQVSWVGQKPELAAFAALYVLVFRIEIHFFVCHCAATSLPRSIMPQCSVFGCKTKSGSEKISVFFSKRLEIEKKWIVACRRSRWIPTSQARVCSDHFDQSRFKISHYHLLKPEDRPRSKK